MSNSMTGRKWLVVFVIGAGILFQGAGGEAPAAAVAMALAVILVVAKLGGELAVRLGQPAVLGELLAGVALGNLHLIGLAWFEPIKGDLFIDLLARLGVLLLLFEVGLESTVKQMLSVGASAAMVALLGVAAPMLLGWGVGAVLLPEASLYVHLFLGATLCATSVGITARVLQELNWSRSREGRIIMGAAVIDDVLGLIVLASVSGLIAAANLGQAASLTGIGWITLKSLLFLGISLAAGIWLSPKIFQAAAWLRGRGVLLAFGLAICFGFAWAAGAVGLAPIVGAFAAGLVLEETHFEKFLQRGERSLEDLLHPLSAFLVPVFFVLMGTHTDLRAFLDLKILGLALALTVAAIIGKQACSLGVIERGLDRLSVGLGMIPRGEVGLIFANQGLMMRYQGVPIIDSAVFSAVVVMVILTTLLTPPVLAARIRRVQRQTAS